MRNIAIIAKREIKGYFTTPLAYIFIVIFLAMSGAFAFYIGGFFNREQASLATFFLYHPWLYLMLVPAIAMRLWAEERKTGTIEILMTLPISTSEAVLGKYLAAWGFTGIALTLTFPMWITVNVLGRDVTATIANLRDVEWRSLRLNFVVILSPGVIEKAPQTHIATVHAAPDAEAAVERHHR